MHPPGDGLPRWGAVSGRGRWPQGCRLWSSPVEAHVLCIRLPIYSGGLRMDALLAMIKRVLTRLGRSSHMASSKADQITPTGDRGDDRPRQRPSRDPVAGASLCHGSEEGLVNLDSIRPRREPATVMSMFKFLSSGK